MTGDFDLIPMPMLLPELTPESRALEGAAGTPVVLADGRTWLLCDGGLLNELDGLRDGIDDASRLSGEVGMLVVAEAACHLLTANYDLDPSEVMTLVAGAVDQPLADAVREALFGPAAPRRTYTTWAASALIANGIDPASVPSALRPHVLAQLESTGRCVKRSLYIESAEAGRKFARIRARVAARASSPAPAGVGDEMAATAIPDAPKAGG
jgi:hypothetical protein